jgi:hypothetical protein
MDISWKQAGLGLCAMVMLAAVIRPSAFDDHPAARPLPAKPAASKVIVEKHTMPVKPDGYMSEKDCAGVPNGMLVADLVYKYGWPAGDYSVSAFAERLFYPVHSAGDDKCVVEYDHNKVVSTLYRDE